MFDVFGVPMPALMAQLTVGLVNGSFYALLSLGLAILFGLLGIVNFAHGALYMVGPLAPWMLLPCLGTRSSWRVLPAALVGWRGRSRGGADVLRGEAHHDREDGDPRRGAGAAPG